MPLVDRQSVNEIKDPMLDSAAMAVPRLGDRFPPNSAVIFTHPAAALFRISTREAITASLNVLSLSFSDGWLNQTLDRCS
jgi:hypothetical protein